MSGTIERKALELAQGIASQVLDEADHGFILLDHTHAVVLWNDWLCQASGIEPAQAQGQHLEVLFPELAGSPLLQAVTNCIEEAAQVPTVFTGHRICLFSDSQGGLSRADDISQHFVIKPLQITGQATHCLIQVFDNRHPGLEAPLMQSQKRLEATLSTIADGVIVTDHNEQVVFFNVVAEALTGRKDRDVQGHALAEVLHLLSESNGQYLTGRIASTLCSADSGWLMVGIGGAQFPVEISITEVEEGTVGSGGWVVVFRDVSQSRRMSAQLSWQANHDVLTGLENRQRFEQRLQDLLSSMEQGGKQHALLYLDLDQFKIVNDTCGHEAGDELLRQLANLFKGKMRSYDTLARLGGDEFGVLLENCPIDSANRVAGEFRELAKSFRFAWEDKRFSVGISIGLVAIDENTKDASSILVAADTACYSAKDSGRNRVHIFEHENSAAAQRHGEMQWVSRIQNALDNERLVLYSQLVVPLGQAPTHPPHREVLLRMISVEGDIIAPGAFIPAAERYNLMPALDRWVVQKAFSYIKKQQSQEKGYGSVLNINLSGGSLVEDGFLDFVQTQLREQGVAPERICFEVTETSAIANMEEAVQFISALRHQGCKFALDDFGSGLSSFAYLKKLPVDFLKIDGAFIKDILHDPIHCAMVEAIHRVGNIMGIQTVAEFVEDGPTMERLRDLGIDYAQGYHIEMPGPLN